jgi:hypothetical protein
MIPIEAQIIFLYAVGAIWLGIFLEYLLDKLTK